MRIVEKIVLQILDEGVNNKKTRMAASAVKIQLSQRTFSLTSPVSPKYPFKGDIIPLAFIST